MTESISEVFMMERIFTDTQTELEVSQKGYAVRPFLGADAIEALRHLHAELHADIAPGFSLTAFAPDHDHKYRVHEGIRSIVEPYLKHWAPQHKILLGLYATKGGNGQWGKVPLHQDFSFVDNHEDIGVYIWCPLGDVDERNGCLKVVPGSHAFLKDIASSPTSPTSFHHLLDELDTDVAIPLSMPAGSALFYDSRLLHGSDINLSGQPRMAIVCALIREAQLPRIYYWNRQVPWRLKVVEMDPALVVQYVPESEFPQPLPEGVRLLGSIDCEVSPLQSEALAELREIGMSLR